MRNYADAIGLGLSAKKHKEMNRTHLLIEKFGFNIIIMVKSYIKKCHNMRIRDFNALMLNDVQHGSDVFETFVKRMPRFAHLFPQIHQSFNNRRYQRPSGHVEIRWIDDNIGFGAFAIHDIPAETVIGVYEEQHFCLISEHDEFFK